MDEDQERELQVLGSILNDASAAAIKLSYRLLKTITANFSNEIGHGGYGYVYKGGSQNLTVAVKKLSDARDFDDDLFLKEINCLRITNHRNVVKLLGYCAETHKEMMSFDGRQVLAEDRKRLLCFEYVPNGNIRQYLQRENPHQDNWPRRYKMIRGICNGLRHLHDIKINHLDMKPDNVMLDAEMEAKITDFGLSRLLDQGQSTLVTKNIAGTRRYIAPEYMCNGEISFQADIYSLGIIIKELLSGISMINLENWKESVDMNCPGMRECTEIARKCTEHDKHKRPTVHDVIRDLDELQNIIPQSSVNEEHAQSNPTSLERTVFMLPSGSLTIAWIDDPHYWRWILHPDFRFGECAELLRVYYLKVSRQIAPKDLPAVVTSYTAHLVYKLAPTTMGLQGSVQTARTHHFESDITERQVSLHPKEGGAGSVDGVTYPITRPDGWLELKLGEFSNDKTMTVEILHEVSQKENFPHEDHMSGLIIMGMEIRRH